ncbi:hypothetical protein QM467_15860 [Rhodoblastus sp. 17X3]|uniref:hypothetical protein n=1 Tax=Rhodoblastus sp. 17X3 TaxID=3047026 RepID=UPI0024B853BE|nr:hypothetical protein [Rhodoblastus sp. 17X3]MDI9849531.1 hypothetical protein [Rhodoblastus sp. 17X3]
MALQLWIGNGGHWFFDTSLGVQVGQADQRPDGSWDVEVSDEVFRARDLEAAKRIFLENYDPKKVALSPLSDDGEIEEDEFEIITLA